MGIHSDGLTRRQFISMLSVSPKDAYEVQNVAFDPAYAFVLAYLQAQVRKLMQETSDPWMV